MKSNKDLNERNLKREQERIKERRKKGPKNELIAQARKSQASLKVVFINIL